MSKAAKRLGRGLESLVSNLRGDTATQSEASGGATPIVDTAPSDAAQRPTVDPNELPIESVRPNPFQPRSNVTEWDIESLAGSIRQSGFLQPIAVRPHGKGYEIIAGERRWRAAKSLGMTTIPIVIRQATDEQMLELALVENLQREDLNAIDRAKAYQSLCTRFSLSPEEVGDRLNEDRSTVVNYIRLLELSRPIREMVADGRLSMGHARCLLGVRDDTRRELLAESASRNELSVRTLEEIVRREKKRHLEEPAENSGRKSPPSPHLKDLEAKFEQAVKTKVTIHESRRKGTGRITIEYYSLDDFDRVAQLLGVVTE